MEQNLNIQLAKLEQLVKDGFKASDKSFQEIIRRQDHTNGTVAANQKEIAKLNNENIRIRSIASIFRGLSIIVIVPSISYLLLCYINDREENIIMKENIKQLYTKQSETEQIYKDINELIEKYLVNK